MLSLKRFLCFFILIAITSCNFPSQTQNQTSDITGKWILQNYTGAKDTIFTGDVEFRDTGTILPESRFGYVDGEIKYSLVPPNILRISWNNTDIDVRYRIDEDLLVLMPEDSLFTYIRESDYTISPLPTLPLNTPVPSAMANLPPTKQTATPNTPIPTQGTRTLATVQKLFITPTPVMRFPLPHCAGTQLKVGDTGFVAWDTTANRLRTTPDTHPSNNFVDNGRVPPGGIVEILDGPVCNYGWVLWYVRTTWDVEGWTPETDGDEYWILPIARRQICSDARPTRLIAGKKAFVEEEPDDAVEVFKAMAATFNGASSILYKIKPKEQVDLLEGPFCDGKGANWWRVKTRTGVTGWIRENDGSSPYYFMAPVP